jgi:hypothetical protein
MRSSNCAVLNERSKKLVHFPVNPTGYSALILQARLQAVLQSASAVSQPCVFAAGTTGFLSSLASAGDCE